MHLSVGWTLTYLEAFSLARSHQFPTSETILDVLDDFHSLSLCGYEFISL